MLIVLAPVASLLWVLPHTQRMDDGLGGGEGALIMCTLWLVGYLTFAGELDEACRIFNRVLGCGNHLALISEMADPATGEALGNFPQAFTHVALIHTIRNLNKALEVRAPPEANEMRIGEAASRGSD